MNTARPEAVRWGVLGTALIARQHVIPALQTAERCDLVGIASRSATTAAEAAAAYDVPHAYGTYEAMLADPQIEAIYVPLPNDLHAAWSIRALAARKHVLCEKPITLTIAGVEAVAATA
nr:Gfo/Idh/MocA family oxidoreductase [Acidimicrobiia bacterium]